MDPITVLVTALALGAAGGLKDVTGRAISDAYTALKALVKRRFTDVDLDLIESHPKSSSARGLLEEQLREALPQDAAATAEDIEIFTKTGELLKLIESRSPQIAPAAGVDIGELKASSVLIRNIVAEGVGVRINKVETTGAFTLTDVRAGRRGDPPRK